MTIPTLPSLPVTASSVERQATRSSSSSSSTSSTRLPPLLQASLSSSSSSSSTSNISRRVQESPKHSPSISRAFGATHSSSLHEQSLSRRLTPSISQSEVKLHFQQSGAQSSVESRALFLLEDFFKCVKFHCPHITKIIQARGKLEHIRPRNLHLINPDIATAAAAEFLTFLVNSPVTSKIITLFTRVTVTIDTICFLQAMCDQWSKMTDRRRNIFYSLLTALPDVAEACRKDLICLPDPNKKSTIRDAVSLLDAPISNCWKEIILIRNKTDWRAECCPPNMQGGNEHDTSTFTPHPRLLSILPINLPIVFRSLQETDPSSHLDMISTILLQRPFNERLMCMSELFTQYPAYMDIFPSIINAFTQEDQQTFFSSEILKEFLIQNVALLAEIIANPLKDPLYLAIIRKLSAETLLASLTPTIVELVRGKRHPKTSPEEIFKNLIKCIFKFSSFEERANYILGSEQDPQVFADIFNAGMDSINEEELLIRQDLALELLNRATSIAARHPISTIRTKHLKKFPVEILKKILAQHAFILAKMLTYLPAVKHVQLIFHKLGDDLQHLLTPTCIQLFVDHLVKNNVTHAEFQITLDSKIILMLLQRRDCQGVLLIEHLSNYLPHLMNAYLAAMSPQDRANIMNEPWNNGLSLAERNAIASNETGLWELNKLSSDFTVTEDEYKQKISHVQQLIKEVRILFQEYAYVMSIDSGSQFSDLFRSQIVLELGKNEMPVVGAPAPSSQIKAVQAILKTASLSHLPTKNDTEDPQIKQRFYKLAIIIEECLLIIKHVLCHLDPDHAYIVPDKAYIDCFNRIMELNNAVELNQLDRVLELRNALLSNFPLAGRHMLKMQNISKSQIENEVKAPIKEIKADGNEVIAREAKQAESTTKYHAKKVILGVINHVLNTAIRASLENSQLSTSYAQLIFGVSQHLTSEPLYLDSIKHRISSLWKNPKYVLKIADEISFLSQEVLIQYFEDANPSWSRSDILNNYFRQITLSSLDASSSSSSSSSSTSSTSSSSYTNSYQGQNYKLNSAGIYYILRQFKLIK